MTKIWPLFFYLYIFYLLRIVFNNRASDIMW